MTEKKQCCECAYCMRDVLFDESKQDFYEIFYCMLEQPRVSYDGKPCVK